MTDPRILGKWLCAGCRRTFKRITYYPMLGRALCRRCYKQLMGHSSIQTTIDIYGHLTTDDSRNAVQLLEDWS